MSQAASYARSHGVRAGVGVLDLATGSFYRAGSYDSYFGSASVIKLFVATKLLSVGQMTGWKAAAAYKMITRSDDASLELLLPYVGGTGVINWVKSHYGITDLGTTPAKPDCWGNTHITAKGIVYFYRAITRDKRVGPWLVNALNHHAAYGSDGTNQSFGIAAASAHAAVKQGWGQCSSDEGGSIINTTGIVRSGRYAVAILTETRNGTTNGRSFNSWQASIVSAMARIVLPDGTIDLPSSHNAVSRITSARSTGNTLSVSGWAYDPDRTTAPLTVSLYDGTHRLASAPARTVNPTINRALHISGGHEFVYRVTVGNGTRTVCTVAGNISYGSTSSTEHCVSVKLDGRATGSLTSAKNVDGNAILSGWAWDPDAGSRPINVVVTDQGHRLASYPAASPSPAIDRTRKISGKHGFTIKLAPNDGTHRYCVYAANVGSSYSPATVSIGCTTILAHNDPIGAVQKIGESDGAITITGWAYDPNAPTASSHVSISLDDATPTIVSANLPSDAVDTAQHITGNHAYAASTPASPGPHTVRITELNTGSGRNILRGTYPVTVSVVTYPVTVSVVTYPVTVSVVP